MDILRSILLVLFVIVSVLLIFLVAIQDEKQSGVSGVFGGRNGSTFGSQTSSVVTKITSVLSVIFFVLAISLAFLHKAPSFSSDPLLVQPASSEVVIPDSASDSAVVQSQTNAEALEVPASEVEAK